MRKLSSWTALVLLIVVGIAAIIIACYNEVPGPSGPLPPTREVPSQGPKPGPIAPMPLTPSDATLPLPLPSPGPSASRALTTHVQFAAAAETITAHDVRDGGVDDVVDLPPVPDASGLDAPLDRKR